MATKDPPCEDQAPRVHERPDLQTTKTNGSGAAMINTARLNGQDKLAVDATPAPRKPRSKPPKRPNVATPEDCPILKQQIPLPSQKSVTATSWFWPLAFTIICVVFAAGTWSGRIATQDDGRSTVIGELKANDAALAARIESISADRGRDSERLARLEVLVQSIEKHTQVLLDNSRPKPRRQD